MYSLDTRKIIIKLYDKLKSLRTVQKLTGISKSTIFRWKHNLCSNILLSNKDKITPIIIDTIEVISSTNPFYTINDIHITIKNKLNINCSYQLIRSVIKNKLNLSYKKNKFRNYINLQVLKDKIFTFKNNFKTLFKNNKFIACIDEVGFNSSINPLFSWSVKGKKNYILNKLDTKNRINKSVCACITSNGNNKYKIQNTPFNKTSFVDFLKTLDLPKNTIILLDNVSFHHSKEVINYIKSKMWNLLFIPPYSPNFNPIENIFSYVKSYYRKNKNINHSFSKLTSETIINTINHMITNLDTFYT
jgi:transposase